MKKFDSILKKIFSFFTTFISFLKKITSVAVIRKFDKFLEKIYSTTLIVSCFVIFIIGLIIYGKSQLGWVLPLAILGPILILFIAYLAKDFHEANKDLIKSNTTTIGNAAILNFGAVISLFLSAIFFIFAFIGISEGSLTAVITSLLASLFLFISAGTQFNPTLLNVVVDKKSSAGEDFISIFSLSLKSMLYFEKIISTILLVLGNIILVINLINPSLAYFFSGLGFLSAGIAYPVLIYIFFTIFWFFNSIFLAILSLAKKNK